MYISLSSHISLLNERQSLSKRTQFLRYNHKHHECKETFFVFESRIELKHRCIKYHQWRAKQRWCITTNSTDTHKSRLIASSWVFKFESSTRLEKCRVELNFFWKSVESSWEVEFEHSSRIEKLDSITRFENSIRLDKILDRCK